MPQKSLKIPINRNVVVKKELPKYLGKAANKMRRDEEIDVTEMFMELGRSQKAFEDILTGLIKDLQKKGLI